MGCKFRVLREVCFAESDLDLRFHIGFVQFQCLHCFVAFAPDFVFVAVARHARGLSASNEICGPCVLCDEFSAMSQVLPCFGGFSDVHRCQVWQCLRELDGPFFLCFCPLVLQPAGEVHCGGDASIHLVTGCLHCGS